MGWTLQQMERVGPETWLGAFGREAPHHASDPWGWCWKYTVRAAWLDTKRPGGGGGGGGSGQTGEKASVDGGTAPGGEEDEEELPSQGTSAGATDIETLLRTQAECLQPDDEKGARGVVARGVAAGLDLAAREILWVAVKLSTGFSLKVVRAMAAAAEETRSTALRARKQATGAGRPQSDPVWVQDQGRVLDRLSGALLTKDSFLLVKARKHGGNVHAAQEHWLTGDEAVCQEVTSLVYDPGLTPGVAADGRGVRVFNTYRSSPLKAVGAGAPEEVRPWLDLLRALDLEEGEAGEAGLLDRLAWVVQRPGVKVNHGVLLGGDKGIGKDSFLAPVLAAVGEPNCKVVHGEELASDFCDYLKTKLLVINEIDYGTHKDRKAISEKLKPVLAAPPARLRINEKNLRPYEIRNLLQVFGMTNHRLCLYADTGERRWYMLWCSLVLPAGGPARDRWDAWFTGYWRWLEAGGSGAVLAYLRGRDISGFNPAARPAVTGWLEDIMLQARDPVEAWLLEQIGGAEGIFGDRYVNLADVITVMSTGVGAHWLAGVRGEVGFGRLARAMHGVGARRTRTKEARGWDIGGVARNPDWAHKAGNLDRRIGVHRRRDAAKLGWERKAGVVQPFWA